MKVSSITPCIQEKVEQTRCMSSEIRSPSFADEIKTKIMEMDRLQQESSAAASQAATHGAQNIHETMIKMEEAGISRQLLLKVRGKAHEAYQEMMRMQF